jgi:hypothetical protein
MAETHTKGEQRHRPIAPAVTGSRTAMARASDARTPRFYDPARGREEPPAVTAARERHRALNDQIEAAQRQRERDESRTAPAETGDGDGR